MHVFLITTLLCALGAAAPIADDKTPSFPIQKRAVSCHPRFGQHMDWVDCTLAVSQMRQMVLPSNHPSTGLAMVSMGAFSRLNPDPHYRLPQRFSVGSCTILIDTIVPDTSINMSWDFLTRDADGIINKCVVPNGEGGSNENLGFKTWVLNLGSMDKSLSPAWQQCMTIMNAQHDNDVMTKCVLDLASAPSGSSGGPSSGGSTMTSRSLEAGPDYPSGNSTEVEG